MAWSEHLLLFRWMILLNILSHCPSTISQVIQDLGGSNWSVKNAAKGYILPATVPGGIYTDLMHNNVIGDIFYGFNDINTRWVSQINWNYSRSFIVTEDMLAHNNINLVFDGVDTFASIVVNDAIIGYTNNMFLRYVFDVTSHVMSGKNTIDVHFDSAVNIAQSLFEKQSQKYVVPPQCVSPEYHGECHVNHIRKMQASFAWDWGPAFPSVGIWKKVYLEAYNSSVIRDITVDIKSNAITNHWDIQLNTYFETSTSVKGTLKIELLTDIAKITKIYKVNLKKNEDGEYIARNNLTIPKSYVKLWWPNGYGEANTYPISITFINPTKTERSDKTIKIGFRTVELIQNPVSKGRTFYFKINDIPIFAKGANSIPISILPEKGQNDTNVRFLLQSVKEVNMNMLRVWGGGVYESDTYYEVADELGIMIWQDFMFACSMYPTNDNFLENVRNEVRQQVRRLQYHPSVILWAGNNENEAALRQNWYDTYTNYSLYEKDYVKLYVNTIKKEVLLNDDTRPYLTSSPTNGVESDNEGHVAENPQSHFYGDVHFYNYLTDGWKRSTYPITRFVSEFGYQSMPSLETWLTATNNISDLNNDSLFLASRQHHPMGYGEMQSLINYQLTLPSENSTSYKIAFIFYSQIVQAMSIKIETEYYRQWRSNLNDAGEGLTMGALYWQLNDVWVAPSWSSIDFKNNWKMLHYYAKQFFAPIIVTGGMGLNNKLDVFIVSDLIKPIHHAFVNVSIFQWNSFVPVEEHLITTYILPGVSQQVASFYPFEKKELSDYFVYLTVKDSNNKTIAPDNFIFPIPLKEANLQKPKLEISKITQIDESAKKFAIEITTNKIALFVWLSAKNITGIFSDNGFLQVTPTKTIVFSLQQQTTLNMIQESLCITHLLDPQYL